VVTLAVDTATGTLSVALVAEGPVSHHAQTGVQVLATRSVPAERRHAELLAPTVRELIDSAGQRPDRIVVGVGPGPFTGLRVGVMTARALGQVWEVPVDGVCSLDAMGAAAHRQLAADQPGGGPVEVVAVTDARRREVYAARYRAGRRISGPHVLPPAQLAEQLRTHPARVVGEGATRYPDLLGSGAPPWTPPAAQLVIALTGGLAVRLDPLPLYLRRPDVTPPAVTTVMPSDAAQPALTAPEGGR
jgi:tRNA threonylcarbamoyl adenosine modification protein YeaZ